MPDRAGKLSVGDRLSAKHSKSAKPRRFFWRQCIVGVHARPTLQFLTLARSKAKRVKQT